MTESKPQGGSGTGEGAAPATPADAQAQVERHMRAAADALAAGRVTEAAKIYATLARAFPDQAVLHANLGICLRRLGRPDAAIVSLRRALAFMPNEAGLHSSIGNALLDLGRVDEAIAAQEHALKLAPGHRALRYNYALALRDARRTGDALKVLRELADEFPGDPEYAFDLALTRLRMGDYFEGFRGYEARWKLPRAGTKLREAPQWDGGMISGKTIFLQAEQGFGDAIQFVRYVPRLAQRGARVVLECAPELRRLFAGVEGVAGMVEKGGDAPQTDLSAPLLSLPRLLGTTWATIPNKTPYLAALGSLDLPPLAARAPIRVGLVWGGTPKVRRNVDAAWPLISLAPLLHDPRIAFVSLQKGPRAVELTNLGFSHVIHDLGHRLEDFADTAAAIAQLHLVVTVDTAVAHLAGALGKPVWVLLRYVPDWRWRDEGAETPWYPTMRLFRQAAPGDFDGPVEQVRAELARMLAQGPA